MVDELGLYADDPFSEIGFLQALQFRACRLVADTGLHSMRWTREQTVAFLTEQTGKGANAMTSETDRYCVAPGLAAFNDTLIKTGGVPLSVLPAAVDAYVRGVA